MVTAIDQEQRLLSVDTPLGDDVLILQSFTAAETLSSLFSYQLEMLSANDAITAADIVSQNVTVRVNLADGSQRFFNGYVSQFIGGALHTRELRRYRAEVVPWLWFLTRTTNCRIFQFKSAPQIIEQVFQDLGFSDFEMDLQGSHPERVYCVQYRETAFDFVSRLMEDEGMFYWFRQEDGSHTLVITDHRGAYTDCPENEIEYHPGSLIPDHISQWEHHYAYRSGKYAQTDYNFETPSTSLQTSTNTLIDLPEIDNYERYDYPGGYQIKDDGEHLTKIRMEEDEVPHDVVHCVSGCRSLHPGGKFTLTRHECSSEQDKSYVITGIQHSANDQTQLVGGGETYYENSFKCIPDAVVFRPARNTPKPKIRGPQTAVVVGPAGEEIYTDEFGRVKVQFHWDREGQRDENSSCWMRASQVHAGRGFGGVDIPRIGEEVIIECLEGDPDRPIVTGRVYNGENQPPNGLPGAKMKSGLKSNTTPGGGGDNTVMLDDTKGNEQIKIHGQYNMDTTVDNDQSNTVSNNQTTAVGNDQTITVSNNRNKTVTANQSETVNGNKTITLKGTHTETVTGAMTQQVSSTKSEKITLAKDLFVGAAYQVTVIGAINETVGAAKAEEIAGAKMVSVGALSSEQVIGNKSLQARNISENASSNFSCKAGGKVSAESGAKMSLKAGGDFSASTDAKGAVEAASKLTLKCGGASITLDSGGAITIKGTDITIKGSKIGLKASGDVKIKGSKIGEN